MWKPQHPCYTKDWQDCGGAAYSGMATQSKLKLNFYCKLTARNETNGIFRVSETDFETIGIKMWDYRQKVCKDHNIPVTRRLGEVQAGRWISAYSGMAT